VKACLQAYLEAHLRAHLRAHVRAALSQARTQCLVRQKAISILGILGPGYVEHLLP